MKEIRAFIQPFLLDRIIEALVQLDDFPGMSVSEIRGFGRGRKMSPGSAHPEEIQDFTHKLRMEIFLTDGMVEPVVNALLTAAHSGNRGDGKIFVLPVDEAIRIRTGERGDAAIWSEVGDGASAGGDDSTP